MECSQELSAELLQDWSKLKGSWGPEGFVVPCFVFPRGEKELHLFLFVSASQFSYGLVIYCRFVSDGSATVKLFFSESPLAPIKSTSVPRLKLLAALIGVRALKFVQKQLHWKKSACLCLE